MMQIRRFIQVVFSSLVILSLGLSASQPQSVSAQGGDGIKRQVNTESGKVSFIGPETGRSVSASRALGISSFARPADPALALAKRFAPEFGLKNPERELSVKKSNQLENGRLTVRYQQNYQGVPVMGGELIVNTNANGDLYSMNGEVSSELSLSTEPTIASEQAKQTALQAIAKWYQKTPEDFLSSDPELWIYDESLLRASSHAPELVWRMEVTSVDDSLPVRELVLVNAERGNLSLHFNQLDTAWHSSRNSEMHREKEVVKSTNNASLALAGVTWYVATTGNDSNSCTATANPCKTINGAIGKAANGDTIKVAIGTYTASGTEVVLINKSVTLSGGWNAGFTTQSGMSTIDGQATRSGIHITSGITSIIERFVVYNCLSNGGAGISNIGGTVTLKESTISGNTDYGGGGGISNVNGGVFTINSSTVSGNKASEGGGIANYGTMTLNNSTVSGNVSESSGSGIYTSIGSLTINNTTIYNNSSTYGGSSGAGIYHSPGGSVSIKNTIVAGSTYGSNQGADCAGDITSLGYNLIGNLNQSNCTFTPTAGDLVGYSYETPIDPLLAPLQNNGGPTLTHALRTGSLAINTGNPTTPGTGGNTCLATDQRGTARPVGNRCDIGAYEGSMAWTWTLAPFVNTYTANNTTTLPGTFLCNQTQVNCTNNVIPDADTAHRYAGGTYDLYKNQHNRNGINNNNMPIVSTVHYDVNYENAFWSGTQMVYGDGFARADDVVAHEFTHGVTQYESNLFYYYQSGAINESLSDIWGEYYDQTNGLGSDEAGFKWYLGENIVGIGPNRTMHFPTLYGDPDKMTSPNYHQSEDDNGGVHHNSGINNKAVYLMVDGGTFNGQTVSPLGWVKTLAIYYEVQTNLLRSGSDYSDLYYALQQACSNLIEQKGITAADCQEVKHAIDAVEMNSQPSPNFNTDAPLCDSQQTVNTIFFDNLENGTSKWTFTKTGVDPRWQYDSPYGPFAYSGMHSLYANDYPGTVTDATARLISVVIPSNAYLHFAHAYGFEFDPPSGIYYDGGVLEYSNNGGATWQNAGSLIDYNGYKGTIFTGAGNPLSGRSAFVGDSHGYISTRLNLASLAGQTVTFRWRMGLDQFVSAWGWWVDDVRIFNCTSTISGNAGAAGVTLSYTDVTPKTTISSANGNYSLSVSNNWSGMVTPSHPCFTFTPLNRSYSNVVAHQTTQNYTAALKPASGCADVDVSIGDSNVGRYGVVPGQSLFDRYKMNGGPVHVESTNGLPIFTSQRAVFGNSFNSIVGYPADQLTTDYWFTSYDDTGMITYLVVGNAHPSQTAQVDVYIGGVKMNATPYSIAPGQRIFPRYGINAGPVHVVSTNGVNIFTSERTKFGNSFNEVMGYPGNQLTTDYWFTSYDDAGMITYLVVGNPSSSQTAEVDVYIGGVKQNTTPYQIAPGERIFPRYGINGGPVRVVSTNGVDVFASERTKFGNTFNEVLGFPGNQVYTEFWFTSYDDAGMITYLVIGNPDPNQTAEVDVYIGGVKQNATTYSIAPGQRMFARYGINSGPVHVVSTNGVNVFASERSKYQSSFNEILGLADNRLATGYWFTSYDDVGMTAFLVIGAP